jgi:hypothetical protein
MPPKIEILISFQKKILYVEDAPKHILIVWIFNTTIFCMPFLLSKNGLCMWISAYPVVENIYFSNVPHLVWIWDFVDIYLTHLETRINCPTIHAYLKKLFFGPSKLCCPPLAQGKKTFLSTLNVMLSQTVRNECARFGGYVDIKISYKILRLEILN